jgi:hypothetical protein
MGSLAQDFQGYSLWRNEVKGALERYRAWLNAARLSDAASEERMASLFARLAQERLTIAFVAEFSRGKSELINAIFFAGYGQRILPSAAGRTTMCPTELLYDDTQPPAIRLLPVETREQACSISDFRRQEEAWTVLPLDTASVHGMQEAFQQVSLTRRVPLETAQRYGLGGEGEDELALTADADGMVEIPRWRHAIVNFPHPLLKQGLVIIDTPGLNAIGSEPELTLDLIPNAHAVLFILAADTGVTKSDIAVWRRHIGSGAGRMAVLNKIDSLWDDLRTPGEIERQIGCQVEDAARTLGLELSSLYPVSAQKGLAGKINRDAALLAKSRLPALEQALSAQLIPARRDIVRARLAADIDQLAGSRRALLDARLRNAMEQLLELKGLRGKNRNIVAHMARRIDLEKSEFDASLQSLQGTRAVFSRLSEEVFAHLGMDVVKREIRGARTAMESSLFSAGMREAVRRFFAQAGANLELAGGKIEEISRMLSAMYGKFSTEHGLALTDPMPFSLDKYSAELEYIEQVYQRQFGTAALLSTSQAALMHKFFDSIASRASQSLQVANRDVQTWLRAVMMPLEAQVREHRAQLKERKAAIARIHAAAGELEQRIAALERLQEDLLRQQQAASALETELKEALAREPVPLQEAA